MTWVRDRSRHRDEERQRLRSSLVLSVTALTSLVGIGTLVMHQLEGWSWISSFYFSVTTLTTVGYGDLYPTHELSRLFVSFYVIAGVTVALSAMTVVGSNYLGYLQRKLMRDRWDLRRRSRASRSTPLEHMDPHARS